MTQAESQSSTQGKGKAFFERAEQVATTGNWDFAIELYLEGIQREPDNVERGHQPLREVSLKRKAKGGKGPGMIDQFKRRPGRDALSNLVKAEYLLSKDPGSMAYMEQVLKAAQKLELKLVQLWLCKILLEGQKHMDKPNRRVLLMLTRAFDVLEEYGRASQACELALQSNPDDGELRDIMRSLSAKFTIKAGGYEEEEERKFTDNVRDLEGQQELMQRDALIQDEEYLLEQIKAARQEYLESPKVAGKIGALVDALLKMENESYENEAIDVLTKAHKDSGAYQYRMRIGDIRVKQMTRRFRTLRDSGDTDAATEQARRQLAFEMEEYTERANNYPTDLSIKFELGRRQFLSAQYDEAIGSLQQAQRDPRRTLKAMSLIGQAFTKKGWLDQAADTFERALKVEMTDERAKELRYFLGDVLMRQGEMAKAQQQFSIVAQIDYNYKDVRERVEIIRRRLNELSSGRGAPAEPQE
jgi:tetratricopeptide (TPR) repeat protein